MAATIEMSYDSSENELLDRSLSVWKGLSTKFESEDEFVPLSLDLHTAASLGLFDCVRTIIQR